MNNQLITMDFGSEAMIYLALNYLTKLIYLEVWMLRNQN